MSDFNVTVYASSSQDIPARYFDVAEELGRGIAERGWRLVYGGGRGGLMGAASRGARAAGGAVTGIILQKFIDMGAHCTETAEMTTVTDMRQRKRGLDEAGDAYVALPGGYGTFEELFEIISFKQLGFHDKPVVVLNAFSYYDDFLAMTDKAFGEGFISSEFEGLFDRATSAAEALAAIERARQATGR